MKKETLFEAIGELDEAMLAATENTVTRSTKRLGWRAVLIAAVVAGLAVTAGAAPLIRNALVGGKMETDKTACYTPTNPATGESHREQRHEITLEVEFDEDAPDGIETYYITPEIPEEFEQYHGHIYQDAVCAQFGWIEGTTKRSIFFEQWAGGSVEPGDLVMNLYTRPGETPRHGMKNLGGICGYLTEEPNLNRRSFCWSDGDYLFKLQVPLDYTDAQLEAVVASVRPVDDITPWLCTMTDAEVNDLLDNQ